MLLRKNRNIPENDKCSICKNYITIVHIIDTKIIVPFYKKGE